MAVRQRNVASSATEIKPKFDLNSINDEKQRQSPQQNTGKSMTASFISRQPVWIVLAISSGACAAINGVFAKLTTTSLTSDFSSYISILLGLDAHNAWVNFILRSSFFGLNLLFNGIMWALFTAALTRGNSTTRVSIINVSANFFLTAILGWVIFSERLPPLWWAGAALLACGNVIIGKREEKEVVERVNDDDIGSHQGSAYVDEPDEGAAERQGLVQSDGTMRMSSDPQASSEEEAKRLKEAESVDAPV